MTRRRPWLWPAIGIAAIGLIVLTPIVLIDRASEDRAVTAGLRAREARTLVAAQGQRTVIRLGDGTDVTLGGDSKLTVPPGFAERLRGVGLEGTATFAIAPAQPLVFQVRAKNAVIKAMGTKFTVRAYPNEDVVAIRTTDGQVSVQAGDNLRSLSAGQTILIDGKGHMREPTPQEIEETVGWADGRFVVNQKPMREALAHLQRWYALGLVVRDSVILDRPVSINASLDSSRNAIAALEQSGQVKFGYEGRIRVLRDGRKP